MMTTALILMSAIDLATFNNPSGAWQLNRELSEQPVYEETGFVAPPELLLPCDRLVLTMTATSATFYDADGVRRTYVLSGKKQRSDWRGFQAETRARWNGKTLRIEVKPQLGLVVIESYSLDLNTHRLILSVVPVQRRGNGTRIRYVYDNVLSH